MIASASKTVHRSSYWAMGWTTSFEYYSFSGTAIHQVLRVKRKHQPLLRDIQGSSFWSENNAVVAAIDGSDIIWEGHRHTTGSSSVKNELRYFGETVDSSAKQKARNRTIVQYGRKKNWEKIVELYYKQGKDYGFVNLVTSLSELTKISSFNTVPHKAMIREMLQKIACFMEESLLIDRRNYSRICWSIATLQERGSSAQRILSHLSNAGFAKAFVDDDGHLLDMTKVIWSLSQLNRPDLLENVICQMNEPRLLSFFEFKHRYAATITRSCATLGLPSPELFRMVERRSKWIVSYGSPDTVADMAWACATLGHASPKLFQGIERRSEWMVSNGTPRAVADMAWACATLGYESPEFFQAISGWAEWIVENGNPDAIADMAWACATLGHRLPDLFAAMERRSHDLISNGDSQAMAKMAWASATLGHASPTLFNYIVKRWDDILTNGTEQAVADVRWACGKYGHPVPA